MRSLFDFAFELDESVQQGSYPGALIEPLGNLTIKAPIRG